MTPSVGGFAPYPVYHDPSERDRCETPGCEYPALPGDNLCRDCAIRYLDARIEDMQNDIDDITVRMNQLKTRRAKLIEQ